MSNGDDASAGTDASIFLRNGRVRSRNQPNSKEPFAHADEQKYKGISRRRAVRRQRLVGPWQRFENRGRGAVGDVHRLGI